MRTPDRWPELADSHVHLHAYDDEAIEAMLARARQVGVRTVVAVSVDLASARRTVEIAGRVPAVRAAIGLHPTHLPDAAAAAEWRGLAALARDPRVAAIGECGFDTVEGRQTLAVQREAFRRQVDLAAELRLPLMLHLRGEGAADAALEQLAATGFPPGRALVHYFVGDRRLAERYLAAGLLLAVGKPVTRRENAALRSAIGAAPLERLLLETDAYPLPGRTTEPRDVALVAAAVAELKGLSVEAVASATTENLGRLLEKQRGGAGSAPPVVS